MIVLNELGVFSKGDGLNVDGLVDCGGVYWVVIGLGCILDVGDLLLW